MFARWLACLLTVRCRASQDGPRCLPPPAAADHPSNQHHPRTKRPGQQALAGLATQRACLPRAPAAWHATTLARATSLLCFVLIDDAPASSPSQCPCGPASATAHAIWLSPRFQHTQPDRPAIRLGNITRLAHFPKIRRNSMGWRRVSVRYPGVRKPPEADAQRHRRDLHDQPPLQPTGPACLAVKPRSRLDMDMDMDETQHQHQHLHMRIPGGRPHE